jgi:hypothetical protein
MRTWAACGLVIASSRRLRVPRTAESKDESARLKSSRQALWMMIVTELRSWKRGKTRKTETYLLVRLDGKTEVFVARLPLE